MVMLMIKFGAYKAACCWVCAPSFRADNKTYEETIWERENKAKNQVSEPLLALLPSFVLFSSVFSLPLPLPRRRLFLLCILRGGRGRERDAGTTENASVTDDSEQSSDDE